MAKENTDIDYDAETSEIIQDTRALRYRDGPHKYYPNQIPADVRLQYIGKSIALMAYGEYGIAINDLYIPGKRSEGVHLHDVPAWVMYGAFICASIVMLSVVIDHYDTRDNERYYKQLAKSFTYAGWSFFGLSLVLAIFR